MQKNGLEELQAGDIFYNIVLKKILTYTVTRREDKEDFIEFHAKDHNDRLIFFKIEKSPYNSLTTVTNFCDGKDFKDGREHKFLYKTRLYLYRNLAVQKNIDDCKERIKEVQSILDVYNEELVKLTKELDCNG